MMPILFDTVGQFAIDFSTRRFLVLLQNITKYYYVTVKLEIYRITSEKSVI